MSLPPEAIPGLRAPADPAVAAAMQTLIDIAGQSGYGIIVVIAKHLPTGMTVMLPSDERFIPFCTRLMGAMIATGLADMQPPPAAPKGDPH